MHGFPDVTNMPICEAESRNKPYFQHLNHIILQKAEGETNEHSK